MELSLLKLAAISYLIGSITGANLNSLLHQAEDEAARNFNRENQHSKVKCIQNFIYQYANNDGGALNSIIFDESPQSPLILNGSLWSLYGYTKDEGVRLRDIATIPRHLSDCILTVYVPHTNCLDDLAWLNHTLEQKLDETLKSVSPHFNIIITSCGVNSISEFIMPLYDRTNYLFALHITSENVVDVVVKPEKGVINLIPITRWSHVDLFRHHSDLRNLARRQFNAAVVYGLESVISYNRGSRTWRGIFSRILEMLESKFNCTITVKKINNTFLRKYEGKPWGAYVEILRQRAFDIALDAEQDYTREKVATFSIPIFYETSVFIVPSRVSYPTWTIVSQPFSGGVWALTVGSSIVFMLISIVNAKPESHASRFSIGIFFVLRLLLQNQVERHATKRGVMSIGLIFSCVICIAYTSKLVSYLTRPYDAHPKTFAELVENTAYPIYMRVTNSPSEAMLFKNVTNLRRRITPVESASECILKLLNDSTSACISTDFNAVVEIAANLTRSMDAGLRPTEIGGSHIYINWKEVASNVKRSIGLYYSLALRCTGEFNRATRQWSDNGLFIKWTNQDLQEVHKTQSARRKADVLNGKSDESEKLRKIYKTETKVLKLRNFKGVFIVYGFGVLLALAISLLESGSFIVSRILKRKRYNSRGDLQEVRSSKAFDGRESYPRSRYCYTA